MHFKRSTQRIEPVGEDMVVRPDSDFLNIRAPIAVLIRNIRRSHATFGVFAQVPQVLAIRIGGHTAVVAPTVRTAIECGINRIAALDFLCVTQGSRRIACSTCGYVDAWALARPHDREAQRHVVVGIDRQIRKRNRFAEDGNHAGLNHACIRRIDFCPARATERTRTDIAAHLVGHPQVPIAPFRIERAPIVALYLHWRTQLGLVEREK